MLAHSILTGSQRRAVVVAADTYEVLDGTQRVLAARVHGIDILRCHVVHNLGDVAASVEDELRNDTMLPSEAAWRCHHLNEFAKRMHRRTSYGHQIRPALAEMFGTNEQVVFRLTALYRDTINPDTHDEAVQVLKELDEGAIPLGTAYRRLHSNKSREVRAPEVARIVADDVAQVTAVATQRRAYSSAIASLHGVVGALQSFQKPSSQLTIEELKTYARGMAAARTMATRMARIFEEEIKSREDRTA